MKINVVRFAVDENGAALFPDVFYLVDVDTEFAVEYEGKHFTTYAGYSMHTDLNRMPDEVKKRGAWDWEGLTGREVSFEEWQTAFGKARALKYDFPEDQVRRVSGAQAMRDAIIALWSAGNQQMEETLKVKEEERWVEITEFRSKVK